MEVCERICGYSPKPLLWARAPYKFFLWM